MNSISLASLRTDLSIIQQWIQPNSQVLDLGCGEGQLLRYLQEHKNVRGYGLEINPDKITACIANGVNVVEQNLNDGLRNYKDNSINTVIMTQALQAVERPDELLDEMLRIGDEAIVTFPNFGHWRTRLYLALKGRMPMSETLPHAWYNTPNIHLCTVTDFEELCVAKNIRILSKTVLDDHHQEHWAIHFWPSLLGEIAIYHLTRRT
ncbi:methionine biosynthesis protein MetW [Oceanobacter antarcticus]|uniref:methionine biosynthesis protein MetW n=1 Tax=Oceanospirillaceae TaxID=135620 RepID=UPI003F4E283E|tara:strand:- start:4113 stop:4733 length:621 start_codon:yes stop_codon:yes gene_type:complete